VVQSPVGLGYKATQIGMAFVEISGSVLWFGETRRSTGHWGLLASCANVASWLLVKFLPIAFEQYEVSTTVAHRLSHILQYVVIWSLKTISLNGHLR